MEKREMESPYRQGVSPNGYRGMRNPRQNFYPNNYYSPDVRNQMSNFPMPPVPRHNPVRRSMSYHDNSPRRSMSSSQYPPVNKQEEMIEIRLRKATWEDVKNAPIMKNVKEIVNQLKHDEAVIVNSRSIREEKVIKIDTSYDIDGRCKYCHRS